MSAEGTKLGRYYVYECGNGHFMSTRAPQSQCAAYVLGVRCTGPLKRVGPGSRPRKSDTNPGREHEGSNAG